MVLDYVVRNAVVVQQGTSTSSRGEALVVTVSPGVRLAYWLTKNTRIFGDLSADIPER